MRSEIQSAIPSEDMGFPFRSKRTKQSSSFRYFRSFSPSFSMIFSFMAGEGASGIFSSSCSMMSKGAIGFSRFTYSSMPCRIHFSLIFPIPKMVNFIGFYNLTLHNLISRTC